MAEASYQTGADWVKANDEDYRDGPCDGLCRDRRWRAAHENHVNTTLNALRCKHRQAVVLLGR